jgi:hypothetical protein
MTDEDKRLLRTAAEIIEAEDNQGELRGIVKRLRGMADRKPPEGTVRVRAAVAIDSRGRWEAAGYHGWDDHTTPDSLLNESRLPNKALHWIEADVPVPTTQKIQGAVQPLTGGRG